MFLEHNKQYIYFALTIIMCILAPYSLPSYSEVEHNS